MIEGVAQVAQSMMPRWWLAPDYDALLTDAEGLAFELREASVKAMTEEQVARRQRAAAGAAGESPLAKKWADNMTAHYDELSRPGPDLRPVAQLHGPGRGGRLDLAAQPDREVRLEHAAAAQSRLEGGALQCPANSTRPPAPCRSAATWIISASGGVQINPWQPLEPPPNRPRRYARNGRSHQRLVVELTQGEFSAANSR